MKIINDPPNSAVENARLFVDSAFHEVNWTNFTEEIRILEFCEMLPLDVARDIQKFLHGALRRLFWEIRLSPKEYLEARRVFEAVCDVIDSINAVHGPEELKRILGDHL